MLNITPLADGSSLVDEIYAFVADNIAANGEIAEGIVSAQRNIAGQDVLMPFIFSDEAKVDKILPMVKKMLRSSGSQVKVKLVKFHTKEVLMEDITNKY